MSSVKRLLLLQLSLAAMCSGYRILAIFPHQMRSHFDVFEPLLKELSARHHDVTVISHFPQIRKTRGYNDISLNGTADILVNVVSLNQIKSSRIDKYITSHFITHFSNTACRNGLSSRIIQDFIKSDIKFDLILAEFFSSNCFLGLLKTFNAPLIGLSSCVLLPWTHTYFGNTDNPSYIPNVFMDYSDKMTFIERLENTIVYLANKGFYQYLSVRPANEDVHKYLGYEAVDVEEFASNASLLLVNTHFSLNRPKPNVPNVIEVSGLHLKKKDKLPVNIEKWITESEEGVIYFSMGSMIKGHTFPEDKRRAFLRAFGRLKQRVLWKWENETMPEKPDNVMIQKWMPQFDILCHPNVKAFISHGGLLGTTEAVHCGVPVVVMPQFGDQHTNAAALQASGGGVVLNFRDADEDMVYNALKTVLDPEFNKKAKELSERFRDRPMPPLETAIYWIEYVARHKGAHHMRTAAVGMPFYQYLLLDVVAFLLTIFLLLSYIMYFITKTILRRIFKKDKVKKS